MTDKTKKKIVVACRGGSFRTLLATELEKRGFEAYPAGNGTSALEITLSRHPAALIIDFPLDVIPPEKLVPILRANPLTKETPIIGLCRDEREIPGLRRGTDVYLKKPLKTVDIVSRVTELIQGEDAASKDGKVSAGMEDSHPKKIPHLELVKSDPAPRDDVIDLSFEEFIDSVKDDPEGESEETDVDPEQVGIPDLSFEGEKIFDADAVSPVGNERIEMDAEPLTVFPEEDHTPFTGKEQESPDELYHEPVVLKTSFDETGALAVPDVSGTEPAGIGESAGTEPPPVEPDEEPAAEGDIS